MEFNLELIFIQKNILFVSSQSLSQFIHTHISLGETVSIDAPILGEIKESEIETEVSCYLHIDWNKLPDLLSLLFSQEQLSYIRSSHDHINTLAIPIDFNEYDGSYTSIVFFSNVKEGIEYILRYSSNQL